VPYFRAEGRVLSQVDANQQIVRVLRTNYTLWSALFVKICLKEVHEILRNFLDEEQRIAFRRRAKLIGFLTHPINLPNVVASMLRTDVLIEFPSSDCISNSTLNFTVPLPKLKFLHAAVAIE